MSTDSPTGPYTLDVLQTVYAERLHQDVKHPQPVLDREDGTGQRLDGLQARLARSLTDTKAKAGTVTWRHILDEEVREAFAETDPVALRTELVQVAAVAVAWVEALDRRTERTDQ